MVDSNTKIDKKALILLPKITQKKAEIRTIPGDECEWEFNFSTDISDYNAVGTEFSPWNIFAVL